MAEAKAKKAPAKKAAAKKSYTVDGVTIDVPVGVSRDRIAMALSKVKDSVLSGA